MNDWNALDLNSVPIPTDNPNERREQEDHSQDLPEASVYFKNLQQRLCDYIRTADAVVGCVAWLTNRAVLRELAKKSSVSLVVQKEDFLRPDVWFQQSTNKNDLRGMYGALRCNLNRYEMPHIVSSLSICSDPYVDPVRCMGMVGTDKAKVIPRMHHKFMVFCRIHTNPYDIEGVEDSRGELLMRPYAVWTGSYNPTENAERSLENAVVLYTPHVVQAYMKEWAQVLALSERLDWTSEWVEPEWRVGT